MCVTYARRRDGAAAPEAAFPISPPSHFSILLSCLLLPRHVPNHYVIQVLYDPRSNLMLLVGSAKPLPHHRHY